VLTDEKVIAETFSKTFKDGIDEIIHNIPISEKRASFSSVKQSIYLEPTDIEEVQFIIRILKNVASGIDNIKAHTIKNIMYEIAPILCHLINCMFQSGIYPKIYKTAIVIPINKSQKKNDANDYRPVSILICFNKIVEKIIYKRIMGFVQAKKILSNRQFGFREESNTTIAALELVNYMQHKIDERRKLSLVFMDIQKAFDSVDKELLLESLYNCGIRGTAWQLIDSYLTNRIQKVKVGNAISSEKYIESGVVQGGILGSLLFILFFNDITKLPINGQIFLYADDALLVNDYDKNEKIDEKVRSDMKIICEFLNQRKLALNKTKTFFMVVHSQYMKINDESMIRIDENFEMKRLQTAKYLGLIIDQNLKWDAHCQHLESKLSRASGMLWKVKNKLPMFIRKTLYHSLFESHLLYMNVIWGNANEKLIYPLQVIQNRALRSVFSLNRDINRVEMYEKHVENCLPIRGLNFLSTATYVYNNIHKKCLSNIDFERSINEEYELRNNNDLRPMRCRTNYGQKSITTYGIKVFNSIPDSIQLMRTTASFKTSLKLHLKKEDFLSQCFSGHFLKYFSGQS
jgi:hypothetical protein